MVSSAARSSALEAYDVTARVAHGGMAAIYVATDARGHEVAVKVLHPHLAEDEHIRHMFLHEASLASRLSHPNVVHVHEHGDDPSYGAFIVMEYVHGADLANVLKAASKRKHRIDARVVVRLMVDLCRGLHAAHTLSSDDGEPLNLVHRDVSPHNLLIGDDGVARLTDFGIAKSDERYTMTRPGQLKGKLSYMSPEQLAHEDDPDQRVDVFAAGVLLWEALLIKRLFKGDDEVATINAVLLSKIDPPSKFYPELAPLDEVVERALAREPEDRYPSAEAMADALEEAAEAIGGAADRELCREELGPLIADELARRHERIERASLTPPGVEPVSESQSISLTPEEAAPSGRWVGTVIGLLLLLIGVCGTAIAWIVWSTPDEPGPVVETATPAPDMEEPAPEDPPEEPAPTPALPAPPPIAEATPVPNPSPRPTPAPMRTPYEAEPAEAPTSELAPMEGTPNPYGD